MMSAALPPYRIRAAALPARRALRAWQAGRSVQ